jgi:hypothetical protein
MVEGMALLVLPVIADDLVLQIHERDFPAIAAMARDFFAIPGTVYLLSAFSQNHNISTAKPAPLCTLTPS